jgi:hypothetical protein
MSESELTQQRTLRQLVEELKPAGLEKSRHDETEFHSGEYWLKLECCVKLNRLQGSVLCTRWAGIYHVVMFFL